MSRSLGLDPSWVSYQTSCWCFSCNFWHSSLCLCRISTFVAPVSSARKHGVSTAVAAAIKNRAVRRPWPSMAGAITIVKQWSYNWGPYKWPKMGFHDFLLTPIKWSCWTYPGWHYIYIYIFFYYLFCLFCSKSQVLNLHECQEPASFSCGLHSTLPRLWKSWHSNNLLECFLSSCIYFVFSTKILA